MTKRITYIDSLRGFTMLLVVMNHVTAYCLGAPFNLNHIAEGCYSLAVYFREFRMPLFFFISGFVLYKSDDLWDLSHIVKFFKKKFPVQLLSPFLFFVIYLFVMDIPLLEGIYNPTKKGYWFTFTLLELYVFYAIARYICRCLKLSSKKIDCCMIAWGGVVYLFSKVVKDNLICDILIMNKLYFLFFLILGTLTRKHFDKFERMLDGNWLLPLSVVLFFGLNIFCLIPPIQSLIYQLLALPGIIIVFAFFRKMGNSKNSTQNTPIQSHTCTELATSKIQQSMSLKSLFHSPLQYIGRRTLDIYLLHYFFLPRKIFDVCPLFREQAMPVLELAASLAVTIVVVVVCLIVGEVLRLNPIMAHWLFGAKIENPSMSNNK